MVGGEVPLEMAEVFPVAWCTPRLILSRDNTL